MGRTKGEAHGKARPSSSSFAATLSQGIASAGFGGYVGSTRVDAGPSEEAYMNIDGETAANLRRLSKKDPITKVKALTALTTYFQEHSAAEVSAVLPSWVFEYKKLVFDNSRQTREATHKAMCSLVSTVGRSLAPHLRSLMGAWWMSHFDPFHEVSDAAKQALQVAFPGQKKRLEALSFCAADILLYIDDNLKLTPQTISDKSTPAEESIEKHERVISSSLLALTAILTILFASENGEESASKTEALVTASVKLFRNHKLFQGLVKSGKPRTRSAAYQAIQVYVQHVPDAISSDNLEVAAKFILGTFQEKDPSCHQGMWDMILIFSRYFGEAWEFSSSKKVVYPRLWAFLRHGCYSSQQVSYPCLLPLLMLIPPPALSPAKEFFVELFTNLLKGTEEGSWTYAQGVLLLDATKECFMWLISREERFFSTEAALSLRAFFIKTVLFGALWRTYIGSQKTPSSFLPEPFIKGIGNCIADIVNLLDNELLATVWICLREECLTLFLANSSQVSNRLLHCFLTFDTVLGEERKTQLSNNVVKPFVAECFACIKNSEQPEALKLFSGLVSSYGLHVFDLLASKNWKGDTELQIDMTDPALENVLTSKYLHYLFQNDLIPWAVRGQPNELKVYVLLTFLEDEMFFGEWDCVLSYVSDIQYSARATVLYQLIKTLQEHYACQKTAYKLERWSSPKVDEIVVSILSHDEASAHDLIRTILEGICYEGTYFSILSKGAVEKVMDELLKIMVSAIYRSQYQAAISLSVFFVPSAFEESHVESAKPAIDTILACWPSLNIVDEISELRIMALGIIFCLYWAYMPLLEVDDNEEGILVGDMKAEQALAHSIRQARQSIVSLCGELSRRQLRDKLIGGVRNILQEHQPDEIYKTAAFWVIDTIHLTCLSSEETQEALDMLLAATDYWPFWTAATGVNRVSFEVKKHREFSSMIIEISRDLGTEALFLGNNSNARPWLIVELICHDEASNSYIFPFLQVCARNENGSRQRVLLDFVLQTLFGRAPDGDPYLRSLLGVLRALVGHDGPFGRKECELLFATYVSKSTSSSILPRILEAMMPTLTRRNFGDTVFPSELESKICDWLQIALNVPIASDGMIWMEVAVACFPLDTAGGVTALLAASKADISERQKNLLLCLLRKQSGKFQDFASDESSNLSVRLIVAKLIAPAVAYCWKDFGLEDWAYVLGQLRKWIEDAVVHSEEVTEAVAAVSEDVAFKVAEEDSDTCLNILETAVTILSLVQGLRSLEEASGAESSERLEEAQWSKFEARAIDNLFRVFLATGLAESLASTDDALRQELAMQRSRCTRLWDRVAEIALNAPVKIRETAVRAADLWGLGKSGISALYALLFSPHPLTSLQWISYKFLSTEPLQHQALTWKPVASKSSEDEPSDMLSQGDASFDFIRPELMAVLGTPASKLFENSTSMGHYFLAWSLFLTHLQSLGALSPARDRLLQYAKDSNKLTLLLDVLFHYIPTKRTVKKEDLQLSPVVEAAKRSAATASVSFAVEALLWSDNTNDFGVVSGALYGLFLRVLPACLQTWFADIREKGAAVAIEAFTADYCSPQLLTDEFNQVQAAAFTEDNLVFKAHRSLREVSAVYKREDATMDISLKLPACYPLKAVEVDCPRYLGISEARLGKWILSMASFLRNQNGSLADAVLIWKRNVDREFDGVEECPICYSIIHTSNHSLPRLACKTCRHKFHGACLYKWFSSSHKSTCPLCQTPF